MTETSPLTISELEAGLEHIRQSPKDHGVLQMIVCRPGTDERKVLDAGELTLQEGLAGDNWRARGDWRSVESPAYAEVQLTLMNARVIALIAQQQERWPLAGDQLFVDLDLSSENLPTGTRLALGSAVIEVTAEPHTGCSKFAARFGADARRFVNSPETRQLHLRGINARVVQPGHVQPGDTVRKVASPA